VGAWAPTSWERGAGKGTAVPFPAQHCRGPARQRPILLRVGVRLGFVIRTDAAIDDGNQEHTRKGGAPSTFTSCVLDHDV
jgi:hypothetical protein